MSATHHSKLWADLTALRQVCETLVFDTQLRATIGNPSLYAMRLPTGWELSDKSVVAHTFSAYQ